MTFDPKAYAAESRSAATKAFDPKAYAASVASEPQTFVWQGRELPKFSTPTEAAGPDVGLVESFVRSAGQSATLGFADEIAGGFESLFTDKSYTQARDESRKNFRAAEEANPLASLAGSVAGGFVPVPGLSGLSAIKAVAGLAKTSANAAKVVKVAENLTKANTVGATILKGATLGAASGAGFSESNTLGGVVGDAALGGAVGGAVSGAIKKGVDTLAGRLSKNITKNASDGAKAGMRDKVAALDPDQVLQMVVNDDAAGLAKALGLKGTGFVKGKDQAAVAREAGDLAEKLSSSNKSAYSNFDKATGGGLDVKALAGRLEAKAEEYRLNPQGLDQAKRLDGIVADMKATWGEVNGKRLPEAKRILDAGPAALADDEAKAWYNAAKQVAATGDVLSNVKKPTADVRKFVTSIQTKSFEGATDPTAAQVIKRQVARDMKDAFDEALLSVVEKEPSLAEPFKAVAQQNAKIHALLQIKDAAEFAANREATGSPRIGKIGSGLVDLGLIGSGNLGGIALKKAAEIAMPRLDNVTSLAAYKLIEAAKRGSPLAQLTEMAAELGLPLAAAQAAARLNQPKAQE